MAGCLSDGLARRLWIYASGFSAENTRSRAHASNSWVHLFGFFMNLSNLSHRLEVQFQGTGPIEAVQTHKV